MHQRCDSLTGTPQVVHYLAPFPDAPGPEMETQEDVVSKTSCENTTLKGVTSCGRARSRSPLADIIAMKAMNR